MRIKESENSIKKVAKITGILYLIMFIAAPLSAMVFLKGIVVPGDAAATAGNILAHDGLFRLGIMSNLSVQVLHIFLVVFLYRLLKSVDKSQAILLMVLGLAGVPIAMLNELNQFAPLLLLSGPDYLTVFKADQLNAMANVFLNLHQQGIMIAQIFWGLWLFPLGTLVFKSGYIPKILGILLIIGGIGYITDVITVFAFPNLGVTISMFTFWGEVILPLWLLIKGVNVEKWRNTLEAN